MKANEAPEKLYMNWVNYPLEEMQVEYTRTDAFIEKVCEFIAGNMKCSGYTTQTKAKFIKEFRNYMKGE